MPILETPETDADVEGLKLMVDASIDPTGMVEFFQLWSKKKTN